jgi:hypothetical protein
MVLTKLIAQKIKINETKRNKLRFSLNEKLNVNVIKNLNYYRLKALT